MKNLFMNKNKNMRNIRWIWALVMTGVLAGVMTSCGGGKGKTDDASSATVNQGTLVFDTYSYDLLARVEGDTVERVGGGYVRYTGQGVLPRDLDGGSVHALRDSLLKMASLEAVDGDGVLPKVGEDLKLTDLRGDSLDACGLSRIKVSAALVSPTVVVFEVDREGYSCGAAHGNHTTSYLNYNVQAGRPITLSELMNAGYEDKLAALIRANLEEQGVSLLVEPEEVEVSSSFSVTPGGLKFSYDPYEIAPYSEGTVEVEISTGALAQQGLLSPEGRSLLTGE